MRTALLSGSIVLMTALVCPPQVRAADYIESTRVYADEGSQVCADQSILSRITSRFGYQVTHVPHLPDVAIVDYRDIRQNRYLPARADRPIARRYCQATAMLSDGHDRTVWYLIEDGMGFAGIGRNVEFCVNGFDRWHVYNGGCRVLR